MRTAWCLAALAALACGALAEEVLTLTGSTFDEAVAKHEKLIVEFYAPWCGHCKKLAPEYEKAAGTLKAEGIVLAKVDATQEENKALAGKYEIRGFPTLKIFRGDAASPSEYQGPRDAGGIQAYAKKEFGPASELLESEDAVAAAKANDVVVVGVFPKGEASNDFQTFMAVASTLRNDATFVHVFDASLVAESTADADSVVVFKQFDDPVEKFEGTIEKAALSEFVAKATTPRLVSLDRSDRNKKALSAIFADQKPKLLGFMEADHAELGAFKEKLIAVNEANDGIHVIFVDPKSNPGALEFFGLKVSETPLLAVHAPAENGKYTSGTIAVDSIGSWVADYFAGKVEKTVKSEDVPESNDEPVKVVVAKEFDSIVFGGKDVLIEFYSPRCGHCKKLAPTWEELAESFKDNENIIIAKMDATANDVPSSKFKVQGYPTIYFVSGENGEVKEYSGNRSVEDFTSFITRNAAVSVMSKDEL